MQGFKKGVVLKFRKCISHYQNHRIIAITQKYAFLKLTLLIIQEKNSRQLRLQFSPAFIGQAVYPVGVKRMG